MVYTHLIAVGSDHYHVKTVKTLKEACALAEAGFTYFTTMEGVQIFRKPK
jgi:hypothetical protein